MSLLNKNRVDEVTSKSIDSGEVLNKGKKESIWNKEINFSDIFKGKKNKTRVEAVEKLQSVRLVSVDIGTSHTKIVEGKANKNGKLQIFNMYKVPTKENAIKDGVLEETDVLSMYLQGALKEGKIKTKNLAFVSSSSTIISRELTLPYVDNEEEFSNLVKYEIQQYLFINLNNYDVQYMKIADVVEEGIEKQKVLAVIYPKEMIDKYRELGQKTLLNPYALDITNNCVRKIASGAKFFNSDLINGEAINMYLDMGANTINISIINNGKLDFIRVLPMGGNEINELIMTLENISYEEAERIKVKSLDMEKNEESKLFNGVIRIVDDWIDNVNRIIQFYASKTSGKNIEHIYLYGGSSKIKGIAEYFQSRIGIATTNILTVDNLEFADNTKVATVEEYINALGALIRL